MNKLKVEKYGYSTLEKIALQAQINEIKFIHKDQFHPFTKKSYANSPKKLFSTLSHFGQAACSPTLRVLILLWLTGADNQRKAFLPPAHPLLIAHLLNAESDNAKYFRSITPNGVVSEKHNDFQKTAFA